jgi:serine/threonine-protein kinase
MLKHMQDAPPSVLEERPDLPPAVGLIISRALAKRPENRYRTAGALVNDLSIALESEDSADLPSVGVKSVETQIPDEARDEWPDEETLVRPRVTPVPVQPLPSRPDLRTRPMPPPISSFNPWKILIPALAGLLVIFGVIYVFTRGTETNSATPVEPALVADPNSQPVEPSPPATGKNEAGIPTGGATSTLPENVNANAAVSPTPLEDFTPDTNAEVDDDSNVNSNTNRPANRPLPSPTRQTNSNSEGPPPPPVVRPSPRPSVPPPSPTENDQREIEDPEISVLLRN